MMNLTDVGHLVSDADIGEDKLEGLGTTRLPVGWLSTAYRGSGL